MVCYILSSTVPLQPGQHNVGHSQVHSAMQNCELCFSNVGERDEAIFYWVGEHSAPTICTLILETLYLLGLCAVYISLAFRRPDSIVSAVS